MRRGLLALVMFGCAADAFAQAPSAQQLYAQSSFSVGNARSMSLGGAYVAVAEGASYTSNLASFAQPSAWRDEWWDADLTFQYVATAGGQDLDNDRVVDGQDARFALIGVALRLGRFGLGAYWRSSDLSVCASSPCGMAEPVTLSNAGIALSGALYDGQLVAAVGVQTLSVRLGDKADGIREYAGAAITIDLLSRPRGKPFRFGVSYRPRIVATVRPDVAPGPQSAFTRPPPSSAVGPQVLSFGVAAKLDEGGDGLNDVRERPDDPTAALDATAMVRDIFRTRKEKPPGRWLVTAQLDVTFPEPNAAQLDHFVRDVAPVPMGRQVLLTPRAGVEHITAPGRLRLRLGSWLEPSPWPGGVWRPHVTGGFDLFLFHFYLDFGLTGSVDVASQVRQGSVSFGVWH